MKQLHELMQKILDEGTHTSDRTGTGVTKLVGQQMRFNLKDGFPAVTTKRLAWRSMLSELLWFIEGSHDERRLCEILHGTRDPSKRTIWTDNYEEQGVALGYPEGELGPVYGKQWREWVDCKAVMPHELSLAHFCDDPRNGYLFIAEDEDSGIKFYKRTIDQVAELLDSLANNPDSRRHIINAWNVGELDQMALPACHTLSQYFVINGELHCHLYQRSADIFLGVPFNIASYSLFTHMLAQVLDLGVGEFVWTGGDCHIYDNHVDQVRTQLARTPQELPTLVMDKSITSIDNFTMDSCKLINYTPMDTIKAPMAK